MSIWPDSLSARLLWASLGGLFLVLLAAAWLLHDERNSSFQRYWQDQQIQEIANLYNSFRALPESDWPRLVQKLSQADRQIRLDPEALVQRPPQLPLERLLQRRLSRALPELQRGEARLLLLLARSESERHADHRHLPLKGFVVSLKLSPQQWLNLSWQAQHPVPPWAWGSLLLLVLVIVLVVILVLWFSQVLNRPLKALAQAADQLGLGQDLALLEVRGPKEVRQTIKAFNRMQQRLQKNLSDRNLMLAAISHDLRTPLTTLRLRAEFMGDEEQRAKTLQTLEQMEAILNDTLAFARADAQSATRRFDLVELIRSVHDEFYDNGLVFEINLPAKALLQSRPQALQRVLHNLLENACKYASEVELQLQETPEFWLIRIADRGPGIPEDLLTEVFTPFYRLESSRNTSTGGIGLGLAIVQMLVEAQGGSTQLRNRPGGGLCAELELPKSVALKA